MPFTTIVDAATLSEHLSDPDWVVFDCRFALLEPDEGREQYAHSHIPGARYADLDLDLSRSKQSDTGRHPLPDVDVFVEWLRDNGVNQDSQVVVYDASGGMFAARLWWMLRWFGHNRVAVLDGGWSTWQAQGQPTAFAVPDPETGNFAGRPDQDMWVSSEDVEKVVADTQARNRIIDARAEPRYQGLNEPIDPVAGHVPGALNYPCTRNLDDDGLFLSAAALKRNWEPLLEDRNPAEIINMCGSGVTACRNILAMEMAGWPGTRLYVGSWSEWITDPARPIARSG